MNILDQAIAVKEGKLKIDDVPKRIRKTVDHLAGVVDATYKPTNTHNTRFKKYSATSRGKFIRKVRTA